MYLSFCAELVLASSPASSCCPSVSVTAASVVDVYRIGVRKDAAGPAGKRLLIKTNWITNYDLVRMHDLYIKPPWI